MLQLVHFSDPQLLQEGWGEGGWLAVPNPGSLVCLKQLCFFGGKCLVEVSVETLKERPVMAPAWVDPEAPLVEL